VIGREECRNLKKRGMKEESKEGQEGETERKDEERVKRARHGAR